MEILVMGGTWWGSFEVRWCRWDVSIFLGEGAGEELKEACERER